MRRFKDPWGVTCLPLGLFKNFLEGFLNDLRGREFTSNARDVGLIPGSGGPPGGGRGNPLQFLPGKFHVETRLAGHSP